VTLRAVLLGFLGAVGICAVTYFNDAVMHQRTLIGNHMPMSIYGGLILFVLVCNPILFWIYRSLALSGRELAVILSMILAACCVPGAGLMRTFTCALIIPHHLARTQPGWKDHRVIELTPEKMLADVELKEVVAATGDQGRGQSQESIIGKIVNRTENVVVLEDVKGREHRIPADRIRDIRARRCEGQRASHSGRPDQGHPRRGQERGVGGIHPEPAPTGDA